MPDALIKVISLKKHFPIEKGFFKRKIGVVRAVDDVSFAIARQQILGIVGESGSGKTTLGLTMVRGLDPTGGQLLFNMGGDNTVDITTLNWNELSSFRRQVNVIFQDPFSALNPRMTVMDIICEPLVINRMARGRELADRAEHLMAIVGLDPKYLKRYPHAFSGGQRQRLGIARALSTNPRFIVADEPTSALDVSIQAQILNLMQDLQEQFGLTYMFISHNLSVVRHISHRIAIMYLGKVVEHGTSQAIFSEPKHPYTESLIRSLPVADPRTPSGKEAAKGEVGDPSNPPKGCHFHPRCDYAIDLCKSSAPELGEVAPDHTVTCHRVDELNLKGIEK